MSGRSRLPAPGAVALRIALAILPAAILLLASGIASACPACANREDGGPVLLSVYATMVLTPFFAVAIGWRVIRSLTGAQSAPVHTNQSTRPPGVVP